MSDAIAMQLTGIAAGTGRRSMDRQAERSPMSYATPEFQGDAIYNINCTGDACVGDEVRFQRAIFAGSFTKPKFAGFETVTGEIIADSYGRVKQQHTFTILTTSGSKTLIKGRNLYANGTWRKRWVDEEQRLKALVEKHHRGAHARNARADRIATAV